MVSIPLNSGAPKPAQQAAPDIALREPLFMPWTLIYDHREREGGWRFTGLIGDANEKYRPLVIPQREMFLKTADYSIDGCPVFIERKSADDILGSITHGHDRFRAEHCRMEEIVKAGGKCFVVIEANYGDTIDTLESGTSARKIHPNALESITASWPAKYGVPWYWCGSRRMAERFAFRLLRTWHERLSNEAGKMAAD